MSCQTPGIGGGSIFETFFSNQMTEIMRTFDAEMGACRQSIERNFGKNQNVSKKNILPEHMDFVWGFSNVLTIFLRREFLILCNSNQVHRSCLLLLKDSVNQLRIEEIKNSRRKNKNSSNLSQIFKSSPKLVVLEAFPRIH